MNSGKGRGKGGGGKGRGGGKGGGGGGKGAADGGGGNRRQERKLGKRQMVRVPLNVKRPAPHNPPWTLPMRQHILTLLLSVLTTISTIAQRSNPFECHIGVLVVSNSITSTSCYHHQLPSIPPLRSFACTFATITNALYLILVKQLQKEQKKHMGEADFYFKEQARYRHHDTKTPFKVPFC
jgi:hypothetical protein